MSQMEISVVHMFHCDGAMVSSSICVTLYAHTREGIMSIEWDIGSLDEVIYVQNQVPEFERTSTREELEQRINDKPSLVLIAKSRGEIVGYQVGYQIDSREFYIWLSGVIPAYRRMGVATTLRKAQENWCSGKGYTAVSVKSMNRYSSMLKMLISSGYKISGYEDKGCADESKIHFFKDIT